MDREITIKLKARWLRHALVALVTASVAFPVGVMASDRFPDVPFDNIFHDDIGAIADAGVTIGFPDGTYRPLDFVTREQMAAFMNRLGALGPDKTPVVNAATAVEADTAATAVEADMVDGRDANQLLRVAFAETDNAPDQSVALVSATITAPTAGWLIMSGGVDSAGADQDAFVCYLTVGADDVTGTVRFTSVGPGNIEENCETTGVQQVSAGEHTIALQIGARETAVFGHASAWAFFVPFEGTGSSPAD